MQEYTYIVEKDGKRLGTIKYGRRNSVPSPKDLEFALKSFPKGSTARLLESIEVY